MQGYKSKQAPDGIKKEGEQQKLYFPNLNGLRFIAAVLVIIHHVEQIKSIYGIESYWQSYPIFGLIGKLGVVLFFVLSGYLITFLLLEEERTLNGIHIFQFYVRRVFRIWPLYFLIVFLALFVLPNIVCLNFPGFPKEVIYSEIITKLILFIFFLPNLVLPLFGLIPFASHTWSIGTEEQFYLVWPILLKLFKKHRLTLMGFIVFLHFAVEEFLLAAPLGKEVLIGFWGSFNIGCMSIGGFFAVLLHQKKSVLKIFMNDMVFYMSLNLLFLLVLKAIYIPLIHYEFYSFLFAIIILNLSNSKTLFFNLENKIFNYMGKISYGLYMFHPIAISISLVFLTSLNYTNNVIIYSLSFILSIIMASLSYEYFESFFLKFKNRQKTEVST